MIPPTSIDGTDITGATIDGTDVTEITVDGDTVFSVSQGVRIRQRGGFAGQALLGTSDLSATVNLGPDDSDRELIIVGAVLEVEPTNKDNYTLTVGNSTATRFFQAASDRPDTEDIVQYYRLADSGNEGTSATITYSFNSDIFHAGFTVFNCDTFTGIADSYSGTSSDGTIQGDTDGFQIYAENYHNSSQVSSITDFGNVQSFDFGTSDFLNTGFNSPSNSSTTTVDFNEDLVTGVLIT